MASGQTRPSGDLGLQVIRAADERDIRDRFDQLTGHSSWPGRELSLSEIAHFGLPRTGLDDRVNAWRTNNLRHLVRGARRALLARKLRLSNFYGSLYLTKLQGDGDTLELGLASMRVVTTAGVNFLVDALQGSVEPEILRFHGYGTGTTAEATGDTDLVTEETTQYSTDNTRPTGTLTEGASANIFQTVATYSPDSGGTRAITEHGIFSVATVGSGTLLDRTVFSAVNVEAGSDSLQSTYDFTITAGS